MVSAWWLLAAVLGGAWTGMLLFAVLAMGGREDGPPADRSAGGSHDGSLGAGGAV
ncbi:MAG: hypothetical protein BroJett026_04570 [Betaproteobacteria bacterium]|nr:MAG: hypothetical protein BroJett026_04570 [Betaproteobacteria bacterium]